MNHNSVAAVSQDKGYGPLTFGFDIGMASVGWAVLNETRIVALGVRAFDAAEHPREKIPLNAKRRMARVARNRIAQRAWRLKRLMRLMRDIGLVESADAERELGKIPAIADRNDISPWALRARGLRERLGPTEWARVLYHLVKHRGFALLRKVELNSESTTIPTERGAGANGQSSPNANTRREVEGLQRGLALTHGALRELAPHFKTIGNIFWCASQPEESLSPMDRKHLEKLDPVLRKSLRQAIRNKGDSYAHASYRADLRDELLELFAAQRSFGNSFVDTALSPATTRLETVQVLNTKRDVSNVFWEQVLALFDLQHPPITERQMSQMIGKCEFEPTQPRAPKNSYANERSTWLQKLNNLEIRSDGNTRPLTSEERSCLINLPFEYETVTYALCREELVKNCLFPSNWREAAFSVLTYRSKVAKNAGWVYVVDDTSADRIPLHKYGIDKSVPKQLVKQRKEVIGKLLERLEFGSVNFGEARRLLEVPQSLKFQIEHTDTQLLTDHDEASEQIPFHNTPDRLLCANTLIKWIASGEVRSKKLSAALMRSLDQLKVGGSVATFEQLRARAMSIDPKLRGSFEVTRQTSFVVEIENEEHTQIPVVFEGAQAIEDEPFVSLKGWHKLKYALAKPHPDLWEEFCTAYKLPESQAGKVAASQIDSIMTALSTCATDAEITEKLKSDAGVDPLHIDSLLNVSVSGFRNLSLLALRTILPHLESGAQYSGACAMAKYDHAKPGGPKKRELYLPPLQTIAFERYRHGNPIPTKTEQRYKDLKNPIVARSFNQARLVLNSLVEKYGSPTYVAVELARDLAKSGEERNKIESDQEINRKRNTAARAAFITSRADAASRLKQPLPTREEGTFALKFKLYKEQNGQCPYTDGDDSHKRIDLDRLLTEGEYTQTDHIWPRSRVSDNSLKNKVLVKAGANQDKLNRTPYEWFGHDEARWLRFEKWVQAQQGMNSDKKARLLAKELDDDEFSARNLVDTRYITRLFANMVRNHLIFANQSLNAGQDISPDDTGMDRLNKFFANCVRTPQGKVTSFLRSRWGLSKDRESSDLHHAIDAAVVAACSVKLIRDVNNWHSREEAETGRYARQSNGCYLDRSTGEILTREQALTKGLIFPEPWNHFAKELLARLSPDGCTYDTTCNRKYDFSNYPANEAVAVKSVLVSRLVRSAKNGEIHDANPVGMSASWIQKRIPLKQLTLEILDEARLPVAYKEHNKGLIAQLRERLQQHSGDAEKAFAAPLDWLPKKASGMQAIRLPIMVKNGKHFQEAPAQCLTEAQAYKRVDLEKLTLKHLTVDKLGEQYYRRNKVLFDALRERLEQFDGDGKKAFTTEFRKPIHSRPRKPGVAAPEQGPVVRSVKLPVPANSGIRVRGGVAGLSAMRCVHVYWTGQAYFFEPQYQAHAEKVFGVVTAPTQAVKLFALRKNDLIEVLRADGSRVFGYFVMFEANDGRLTIRNHDRPGTTRKKAAESDMVNEFIGEEKESSSTSDPTLHRFSLSAVRVLRKYKVGVLGDYSEILVPQKHGLA